MAFKVNYRAGGPKVKLQSSKALLDKKPLQMSELSYAAQ